MAQIRQDVGPRRQALLREASPTAVEAGAVVFEVAAHMHFHLEQLKADDGIAAAITSATAEQLGSPVQVAFRAANGAPPAPVAPEPERAPDKDDLVEAGDEASVDPVEMVADLFDGKVVDDT